MSTAIFSTPVVSSAKLRVIVTHGVSGPVAAMVTAIQPAGHPSTPRTIGRSPPGMGVTSFRMAMLRLLRRLALAAVLLALTPLVLTLLYTVVTPVSTRMVWRMVTLQGYQRSIVPLEAVARPVPAVLIASEDAQFCRHRGVDWRELMAVIEDEDGPSRGASTLPMQVARNLFLWQGDTGPTAVIRKGLEIPSR
jgi:membrane peptidoglycan carboxypeptidase